jgi:hypothetical protein
VTEGWTDMGSGQSVVAGELCEGDLVDLVSVLRDPAAHPWVWQPFGGDETARREAIETAALAAQCEFAVVESVERTDSGAVLVYTDQINLTVPADTRFEVNR